MATPYDPPPIRVHTNGDALRAVAQDACELTAAESIHGSTHKLRFSKNDFVWSDQLTEVGWNRAIADGRIVADGTHRPTTRIYVDSGTAQCPHARATRPIQLARAFSPANVVLQFSRDAQVPAASISKDAWVAAHSAGDLADDL